MRWLTPLGFFAVLSLAIACAKPFPTPTAAPTPSPTPTPTPFARDARSVVEAWLAAEKAVNSERADYESAWELWVKGDSRPRRIDTKGQIYRKGDRILIEAEITSDSTKLSFKQYEFEDEVFLARMVEGRWMADKVTPKIWFSYQERLAELGSLFKRDAMVLEAGVERSSVSGEECDEVKASADLEKLSLVDKEFFLFLGAVAAIIPNVDTYLNNIESFNIRGCILPSGLNVETEITLVVKANAVPAGGIVSSHVLSRTTNLKVNSLIPDSLFILPPSPSPSPTPVQ